MNEQFKAQITYKAREFATAYTNRHFPNEPAFAFGNEGWAKFVDALVELAGALAAPVVPAPAACAETLIFEDYPEFHAEGMGCGLEDRNITDRYEAMRYGWDEALEAVGLNITGFLSDLPQTAPVAQLSELPKLAFDESHIDYIDRYGGFCRDCADEDGVCPSSGLPCGGSKKAIRHVLTALAYGVNHGYIPVILCAAPTTPKVAP